jgi:hypothetical protein
MSDPALLYAPHGEPGNFFCPWQPFQSSLLDLLRWKLRGKAPYDRKTPPRIPRVDNDGSYLGKVGEPASATWVGQATYVVQDEGDVFVTDPHWGARALLPARKSPPGIPLAVVPASAFAVLSHNHYDHLDAWTVKKLPRGMPWFVRERFEAGLAIPPDDAAPANGSTLFRTLVRRQVRSLDWLATPVRFWWMGAFGAGPAGRRTRDREWPRVRAAVDGGRLSRVGLIRHRGLNPLAMKADHQVLAYGYVDDDEITIRCYDPNWPGRDDVTLTIAADGIRQSTGEALIGWFRID